MTNAKLVWQVLKFSAKKFGKDKPVELASSLAFFTILAIPPILIILITILGWIMGEQNASKEVYTQIRALIGEEGTGMITDVVASYRSTDRDTLGMIIGIVVFVLASTTFFVTIQNSLNAIWKVKSKPKSNLLKILIDRSMSIGIIISLAFIILVSLLLDTMVAIMGKNISDIVPWLDETLIYGIDILISLSLATIVFMILFKFLPDVKIKWRVTFVGALITAVFFTIGKFLIGLGLGNSDIGNMYGAAGSVIIVLLWVFYSSLILFFGAEITQQYAEQVDKDIRPKKYAVKVETREVVKPD
ncbi:MAG: YihY/virulence factor BrkB family protein [Bacteroidota bacterium]|nr:YihY/virulence factor BrkB family protein [Bacteroidota bacterium]